MIIMGSYHHVLGDGLLGIPLRETVALLRASNKTKGNIIRGFWQTLTAPVSSTASASSTAAANSRDHLEGINLSQISRLKLRAVADYCYNHSSSDEVAYQAFRDLIAGRRRRDFITYLLRTTKLKAQADSDGELLDELLFSEETELVSTDTDDDGKVQKLARAPKKKRRARDLDEDYESEDDGIEETINYGTIADVGGSSVWTTFEDGDVGLKVTATSSKGTQSEKICPLFKLPKKVFDKLKAHQKDGQVWNVGRVLDRCGGICTCIASSFWRSFNRSCLNSSYCFLTNCRLLFLSFLQAQTKWELARQPKLSLR